MYGKDCKVENDLLAEQTSCNLFLEVLGSEHKVLERCYVLKTVSPVSG